MKNSSLTVDCEKQLKEIDFLKKELLKAAKISEQRIDSLNQSGKHMQSELTKLKNELLLLQKINDKKSNQIDDLEK